MGMVGNFLQLSTEVLDALIADPTDVDAFVYRVVAKHEDSINIDKAWHGIHFLLAGDPSGGEPPLSNVILGGTAIGEDYGYGPPSYLTADEVKEVAMALRDITPEVLRSRYIASELSENDIYPAIWDDPDEDTIGYLAESYRDVREYYLDAAKRGNAMLKFLT